MRPCCLALLLLLVVFSSTASSSSNMFGVTVKRSAFVGETAQQQQQQPMAAGAGPAKRTLQPMVTGTSVLGVKVRDATKRREFLVDRSTDRPTSSCQSIIPRPPGSTKGA